MLFETHKYREMSWESIKALWGSRVGGKRQRYGMPFPYAFLFATKKVSTNPRAARIDSVYRA
jgi:hypothetical protein